MAVKKTDRDQVIDAALALFRVKGYHHTSMADISAACGLLKGSIYHYFPGKKELAIATLDRVIGESREKIFAIAADETMTAADRLRTLAEAVERYFIGKEGGCLIGNLALEVGDSVPEFGERFRRYFDEWAEALTRLLGSRYREADARELAQDTIARVQGAIMMMGVNKDPSVLRRASRDVIALLEPALASSLERELRA